MYQIGLVVFDRHYCFIFQLLNELRIIGESGLLVFFFSLFRFSLFYLCTSSSCISSGNHGKGIRVGNKEKRPLENKTKQKQEIMKKCSRNELRFSKVYASHCGDKKEQKDLNTHFSKEDTQMAHRHMKRYQHH